MSGSTSKYEIFMMCAGGRPEAPVAEEGPIGFADGGNRRDWFPGVRGPRAASCATCNHTNGDIYVMSLTLYAKLNSDKMDAQMERHG